MSGDSFYERAARGEEVLSLLPRNIYLKAEKNASHSPSNMQIDKSLPPVNKQADPALNSKSVSAPAVATTASTAPTRTPSPSTQATANQPEPFAMDKLDPSIVRYLGANGKLAKHHAQFHQRTGQLQMAQAVLSALRESHILLAEAGTGTGKTFAYLIPALLNCHTTVISTGSKALQDQLVAADIPKLVKLMGLKDINFMVLKGFSNYLCLRRFKQAVHDNELTATERTRVEKFMAAEEAALLENPFSCSFADVNARFSSELVSKITIHRQRCLNKKCPYFGDNCFAHKARHYATQARIVVVNHALLFAALNAKNGKKPEKSNAEEVPTLFLPKFDALICDEAHMLPDYGRTFYSHEFDSVTVRAWLDNLQRELLDAKVAGREQYKKPCANLKQALHAAVEYLSAREGKHNFLYLKYQDFDAHTPKEQLQVNQGFRQLMVDIYTKMQAIKKLLRDTVQSTPEPFGNIATEFDDLMQALVMAMNCDEPQKNKMADDNHVCYATLTSDRFTFTIAPLEIGPYFNQELAALLKSKRGLVMTSATLSVRGSFDKFAWDIGAKGLDVRTLLVGSTFDYAKQAMLYLSPHFPDVKDLIRNQLLVQQLGPVMDAVPGGIFFLTTSYRSLQECAILLENYFGTRRKVLVQAGGSSNAQIMRAFKRDGHAVLVGTSSFWAGVDVPGQALMLVIIDKLPFASPVDPFERARADKFKAKGSNPFVTISLPEAIIALRQGVGRLIRSENDQGGLIICDPRVCTQRYGKMIIEALPPMHRCASLSSMEEFFKGLSVV